MSTDSQDSVNPVRHTISCLGWLCLYGVLGYVILSGLLPQVHKKCDEEELKTSRAMFREQMQEIKQGAVNCLVQPDPRFIDELLNDKACAEKICDLYLGGNVSDPRLGRLRELPNLKTVILLAANDPDLFLKELHGLSTIEELSLVYCGPSRRGIEHINSLHNLKWLSLSMNWRGSEDLKGIKNHPSIEKVDITRTNRDDGFIPILQSLPRLHDVTFQTDGNEKESESFERSLRQALPKCRCSVDLRR